MRQTAILALAALPLLAQGAAARDWTVDPTASRIAFTARQMGVPVTGVFESFTASIRFDPATATGAVEVRFEVAKVTGARKEIATELPKPEWFDAARHPVARFTAERFRKEGAGYLAEGSLTLKGVTHPVALPFTLAVEGDSALMRGEAVIRRSLYAVGSGGWARTDVVAEEVGISITLSARGDG